MNEFGTDKDVRFYAQKPPTEEEKGVMLALSRLCGKQYDRDYGCIRAYGSDIWKEWKGTGEMSSGERYELLGIMNSLADSLVPNNLGKQGFRTPYYAFLPEFEDEGDYTPLIRFEEFQNGWVYLIYEVKYLMEEDEDGEVRIVQ